MKTLILSALITLCLAVPSVDVFRCTTHETDPTFEFGHCAPQIDGKDAHYLKAACVDQIQKCKKDGDPCKLIPTPAEAGPVDTQDLAQCDLSQKD